MIQDDFDMAGGFPDAAARMAAAEWPKARRQKHLKTMLVRYPGFRKTVAAVERFHMPVKEGVHGRGEITGLLGQSRAGKSWAIRYYARGLGMVDRQDVVAPRALYVDAVKGMASGQLAAALMDALNLRPKGIRNAGHQLGLVIDEVADCGVELVVIDDAQWMLNSNFSKTVGDTLGFVIALAERNVCNVLLAGTPDIGSVIGRNEHAHNRGGFDHEAVEAYDWRTQEGRAGFRKLLSRIDEQLPFRTLAGLAEVTIAAHLYKLSKGGLIGNVMNYVRAAAYEALNDDAPGIDVGHLQRGAAGRRLPDDPFVPFASAIDLDDPFGDEEREDADLLLQAEQAAAATCGAPPATLSKSRRGRKPASGRRSRPRKGVPPIAAE